MAYKVQFSEKLYTLRKSKGLSQEQIAEKCGVSRQSVSKWETGLAYPETDTLLTLCDLMEVSLDSLLRDTDSKPAPKTAGFSYANYIGKWVQLFLKDREFHGFYRVAIVAISQPLLLFMDDKGQYGLLQENSIRSISCLPVEQTPLPPIPKRREKISDFLIGKTCEVRLKQEEPFSYAKPGDFYPATLYSIADGVIAFHDAHSSRSTVMLSDVLFIKERP